MLVVCGKAWSVYEFWNFTSKLVRSEVTDLLNCSSPCRLWLEVKGEESEGRGKAVSVQLELGEAGRDIFLSISVSVTCECLRGGKRSFFLCRYIFMNSDFHRTI